MIHLVIGGTRSGKSAVAEALATDLAGEAGDVTYLATARVDPGDAEHVARIESHRARRPPHWSTVEVADPADLAQVLASTTGTVLVDSLGTWAAGHDEPGVGRSGSDESSIDELLGAVRSRVGDTVIVSEEVGLAVHPPTALGRAFVDTLGRTNQRLAAVADTVTLVVAGRSLPLAPVPPWPAAGSASGGDPGGARTAAPERGGLRSAVALLTVVGGAARPGPHTLRWFPLVGAGVGGLLAVLWWSASHWWPIGVAAALVVAADLVVTGMLHVDGLADSADGLGPHLPRERRLAVMAAPDTGAFALAVVPTVLLLRWSALTVPAVPELALVVLWSASRTVMATVPAIVPYAREHGLVSSLEAGASRWHALWLLPLSLAGAAVAALTGLLAVVVLAATGAAVVVVARRRVGGYTGDVLGAAGLLGETAGLVVLATM